ncbi:MAG TPA: CHRD domain-containing protein [Hyphomicrobium sp.]|jgi:hypothetical protein
MTATAIRNGLLAAALLVAGTSWAQAETLSFKADLAPVAGTDSKAAGTLTADFDTSSKKLTWRGSYQGLGTYATSAGLYGPANDVVVRLRSVDSPFEGTAIVSERQAPDLSAGRWFVLIRTAGFPNGELRGPLAPVK